MSWGVQAIGKAEKVRADIARQFTTNTCAEPEEGIRQTAAKLIDAALAAQDPASAVKVSASGSQGYRNYTQKTGLHNSLSIAVEPQHGFVE